MTTKKTGGGEKTTVGVEVQPPKIPVTLEVTTRIKGATDGGGKDVPPPAGPASASQQDEPKKCNYIVPVMIAGLLGFLLGFMPLLMSYVGYKSPDTVAGEVKAAVAAETKKFDGWKSPADVTAAIVAATATATKETEKKFDGFKSSADVDALVKSAKDSVVCEAPPKPVAKPAPVKPAAQVSDRPRLAPTVAQIAIVPPHTHAPAVVARLEPSVSVVSPPPVARVVIADAWGWVHPQASATAPKVCYHTTGRLTNKPGQCSSLEVLPAQVGETENGWRTRAAVLAGVIKDVTAAHQNRDVTMSR